VVPIIDRSLVLWKLRPEQLPDNPGDMAALSFGFVSQPELLEHLGADRQVVSHSITVLPDGDLLLSLFLERRPPQA
jgi:hypothetical protein